MRRIGWGLPAEDCYKPSRFIAKSHVIEELGLKPKLYNPFFSGGRTVLSSGALCTHYSSSPRSTSLLYFFFMNHDHHPGTGLTDEIIVMPVI